MSKHTPGPWVWGDKFHGLYGSGEDNEVLCYAGCEGMWLSYGQSIEANARLIAAAPDLLEALKVMLRHATLFNRDTDELWVVVREQARAAIDKAEGEKE